MSQSSENLSLDLTGKERLMTLLLYKDSFGRYIGGPSKLRTFLILEESWIDNFAYAPVKLDLG